MIDYLKVCINTHGEKRLDKWWNTIPGSLL